MVGHVAGIEADRVLVSFADHLTGKEAQCRVPRATVADLNAAPPGTPGPPVRDK